MGWGTVLKDTLWVCSLGVGIKGIIPKTELRKELSSPGPQQGWTPNTSSHAQPLHLVPEKEINATPDHSH